MVQDNLYLGIELGSTRIKCVLLNDEGVVCNGFSDWENELIDNLYTYRYEVITSKIQEAYHNLKENYFLKTKKTLTDIKSIGISGMMHGYLPLDKNYQPLSRFRTWRNTNTSIAAAKLSRLFSFNIPERWSIAHLYQAMIDKEEHLKSLDKLTTLSGYIHYLLTGCFVLGVGEASGMFPLNGHDYDEKMMSLFENTEENKIYHFSLKMLLPKILLCGEEAGKLTESGALYLDPQGDLKPGAVLVPPEGDAGTGMVATNSLKERKGNISVGTSIFLMVVLENKLKNYYHSLDIVATPEGKPTAMVHANNCSSDLNKWLNLFKEYDKVNNIERKADERYSSLFNEAMKYQDDVKVYNYNFFSGEPILTLEDGRPMVIREKDDKFSLSEFILSMLYSTFNVISIGMEPLKKENVNIDALVGHGGLFKTKNVIASLLASAFNTPLITYEHANEGGPYGMALLARYYFYRDMSLEDFLNNKVFNEEKKTITYPDLSRREQYLKYLDQFKNYLNVEKNFVLPSASDSPYQELKERVYRANLDLVKHNLVVLTWGNASEIDREKGVIAIKPSGVDYSTMTVDDIVVVDLDGKVIEGKLKPSSDLKTHLEIYKAFEKIGGVVHTHSTFAVAFCQAGKDIKCYGTTHADYFYGSIPCARTITKEEIDEDYEKNTGKVIVEYFARHNLDPQAMGAILLKNHGPFTFAKNAAKAVENAVVLEEVAKMAYLSETLSPKIEEANKYIQDKHYFRKHGKNAYYGQSDHQ